MVNSQINGMNDNSNRLSVKKTLIIDIHRHNIDEIKNVNYTSNNFLWQNHEYFHFMLLDECLS